MSAPISIGRWRAGVQIVLSTMSGMPCDFASFAIAGMSATKRFGLLGDSTWMSFVFGVIVARPALDLVRLRDPIRLDAHPRHRREKELVGAAVDPVRAHDLVPHFDEMVGRHEGRGHSRRCREPRLRSLEERHPLLEDVVRRVVDASVRETLDLVAVEVRGPFGRLVRKHGALDKREAPSCST